MGAKLFGSFWFQKELCRKRQKIILESSTYLNLCTLYAIVHGISMTVIITLLLLTVGILLIGKGSDWLTDSLIPIARKLGVSSVSVGLILVSAAVSLPEILVAVFATLKGYPGISFGVVLGSIICNIGLMTGLCAMFRPLVVSATTILRDGIFSIVVPILVLAVSSEGQITRFEGLAFLLLFIPYAINVFLQERRITSEERERQREEIELELRLIGFDFGKLRPGWMSFCIGVAVLLFGSQIFSDQLINLVSTFGMSELLVGVTLGAIGPSIPNVMAAFSATKKGMGDIAVSETLGSNIFTMLVTLGILAMLTPISILPQWLHFDLPALLIMSFLLFIFLLTGKEISRLEGSVLLGGYVAILGIQAFVIL